MHGDLKSLSVLRSRARMATFPRGRGRLQARTDLTRFNSLLVSLAPGAKNVFSRKAANFPLARAPAAWPRDAKQFVGDHTTIRCSVRKSGERTAISRGAQPEADIMNRLCIFGTLRGGWMRLGEDGAGASRGPLVSLSGLDEQGDAWRRGTWRAFSRTPTLRQGQAPSGPSDTGEPTAKSAAQRRAISDETFQGVCFPSPEPRVKFTSRGSHVLVAKVLVGGGLRAVRGLNAWRNAGSAAGVVIDTASAREARRP